MLFRTMLRQIGGGALMIGMLCGLAGAALAEPLPRPVHDEPLRKPSESADETIVLAGGCFWGVQAVFQHMTGVRQAVSGYAGGEAETAHYAMVGSGATGHAEAVQVTYDPSQVTLGRILQVFFSVAHDPTQVGGQGPDHGDQYRSAVFYATPEQKTVAEDYVRQLGAAKVFPAPVTTTFEPLDAFYPAEAYHQDYARLHPNDAYIVRNDAPKVRALKKLYPDYYRD